MNKEWLERLLREPDNLFGPPTGRGYDYVRAGLTVAALALGALSGWCAFAAWEGPPHPAVRAVLIPLSAPFHLGARALFFFWPAHLLAAWVAAAGVWYATVYTAACWARLRRPGRARRVVAGVAAAAGWAAGLGLLAWDWSGG